MITLPSSQIHSPWDDEADLCQSSPKPTPNPTVMTVNVMKNMTKPRECSFTAVLKLNCEHEQFHLDDLDLLETFVGD